MEDMKTIAHVRTAFWDAHPQFKDQYKEGQRQNKYNADIRTAFCDYVDYLHKNREISDKLANRVTL